MMRYLIIEWLNDYPVINGANFYKEEKDAIEAALFLEEIAKKAKFKMAISVKYTICKIYEGKVVK